MKRKKKEKASAILAADLHLRADTPLCRTDDYLSAQFRKLDFILGLCEENNCPLLVAGDVGDKSQWPNWLLEKTINVISKNNVEIIVIPGQHDLPEHRLKYVEKSGCGVLNAGGLISIANEKRTVNGEFDLYPFPYGVQVQKPEDDNCSYPKIAMVHQMVIEKKPLWPGQQAPKGNQLLKKFPQYELIVTGDNHNPFVAEYEGRLLVNAGSMMRMTAAQIDYLPRVYKWFSNTNKIEFVHLPVKKKVITRTHLEDKKQRDIRMDKFVTRIKDDFEIELSFEKNLEEYFKVNRTKKAVQNKIWEAVEC